MKQNWFVQHHLFGLKWLLVFLTDLYDSTVEGNNKKHAGQLAKVNKNT